MVEGSPEKEHCSTWKPTARTKQVESNPGIHKHHNFTCRDKGTSSVTLTLLLPYHFAPTASSTEHIHNQYRPAGKNDGKGAVRRKNYSFYSGLDMIQT
jgi:hypothetical protein